MQRILRRISWWIAAKGILSMRAIWSNSSGHVFGFEISHYRYMMSNRGKELRCEYATDIRDYFAGT